MSTNTIYLIITDQYLLHPEMENSPLSPESGRNGNSNGNGNGSGNANGSGNGNTAGQFLSPGQQLIYRSTGTQASLRNGSNSTLPSQHHHLTHNNPTSNSIVSGKEMCEKSIFDYPFTRQRRVKFLLKPLLPRSLL